MTGFNVTGSSLIESGTITSSDRAGRIAFAGSTVFVCDDNAGLIVAEAGSGNTLSLVARVALRTLEPMHPSCVDLAVDGNRLYVASGAGLLLLDITTPSTPTLIGAFLLPTGEWTVNIAVQGRYVYGSLLMVEPSAPLVQRGRLAVFDVQSPAQIQRVWDSALLGGLAEIQLQGGAAFVAGRLDGLHVFDLTNPAVPTLVRTVPLHGDATAVAVGNSTVYVGERTGGITVVRTGRLVL